jgi:hypothetical protein
MRNDPAWAQARAIARSKKQERAQAFSALRKKYRFSEYDLHEYAKQARVSWIADHIDSTMAQTLATRAYHAATRVCVGKAKRVRFRSSGIQRSSLLSSTGVIRWYNMACATELNMCAWSAKLPLHGHREPIKTAIAIRCNW